MDNAEGPFFKDHVAILMEKVSEKSGKTINRPIFVYLLLIGITLIAFALRIYKIGQWSFWIDEIYTIDRAQVGNQALSLMTPVSVRLISLALAAWSTSERSARIVPALIGIITIPILFFPIKKMFDWKVGLIAVSLLAFSTWHLFWSQNARYYSALLLFYALAQFTFYFWLETDRIVFLLLLFLTLGLAFLERLTALFIVPVILSYVIVLLLLHLDRPKGMRWRNLLLFIIPVIFFGVIALIQKTPDFESDFLSHSTNPIRLFASLVNDIGVPLFVIGLLGGLLSFWSKSKAGIFILLGAVVPFIILIFIAPFSLTTSRYLFATLPNWAILAAFGIREIFNQGTRVTRTVAVALILLLIVDFSGQGLLYYQYQNGNRPDWKGAFQVVENEATASDLVYSSRPAIGGYYLGREVLGSQIESLESLMEEGKTAWFVLDNQTGNVSPKLRQWLAQNGQLKAVRDVWLPGKILEMRVFQYQPKSPQNPSPMD